MIFISLSFLCFGVREGLIDLGVIDRCFLVNGIRDGSFYLMYDRLRNPKRCSLRAPFPSPARGFTNHAYQKQDLIKFASLNGLKKSAFCLRVGTSHLIPVSTDRHHIWPNASYVNK